MDKVKEAFQKVKEDMESLKEEIRFLASGLSETKENMSKLTEMIGDLSKKKVDDVSTHASDISTDRQNFSTHNSHLEGLKRQNLEFSTGNQGVSTDRQTDTSTDRQTPKEPKNQSYLDDALKVIDSLDNVKKELRIKFKKVTEQETLVFSTIYQFEEELGYANYKLISKKLNLTESSVRDHVGSLIKKGIPVDKKKVNNKQISLTISPSLRKIAPLPMILRLREL